ncbi:MAG: Glu-tRNA(Gln) amidotransferase subunit GatD [Candidatus Ranarchaeia archaeon]
MSPNKEEKVNADDDTTEIAGYRGQALSFIRKAKVNDGDLIRLRKKNFVAEGILIPRAEIGADDQHLIIKMGNGYNIGVRVERGLEIEKIQEGMPPHVEIPSRKLIKNTKLPTVGIISTGGTIASRVDYKTGAVMAALSAHDLYNVVPELGELVNIRAEVLFSIFSENMDFEHLSKLARTVASHIKDGDDGIVIAHGTDTLHYSSAALAFALQNLPVPICLVGSQRSSDRPSSDAPMNLLAAARVAAYAPFAAVTVVMHGESSDTFALAHPATKVRKCHTSRRDAFRTVNASPLAMITSKEIKVLEKNLLPRDKKRELVIKPRFDKNVALVKTYAGATGDLLDSLIDKGYHGIVIEGTGLGHTPHTMYPAIRRAQELHIPIVMTSQCLWGRINMRVYRTGVELVNMGVIPGQDMLPSVAYVKLAWVLGQTRDPSKIRSLMTTNLVGEISDQTRTSQFFPGV